MSAEGKLGPKKLRKAEEAVGQPLLMAFAWHPWVECVTPDDRHLLWNRGTGEVRKNPDEKWHYSTCPSVAVLFEEEE